MKHIFSCLVALCAVLLLGLGSTQAAVFTVSQSPTINEQVSDDLFSTGNSILINAPVTGDVFVAGKSISVRQPLQKTIYAAGSTVMLENSVNHNAWVVAERVVVKGTIGHDVWIAAGEVTFDTGAVIKGQTRIFANEVNFSGTFEGNVEAYGLYEAIMNATFLGNVKLESNKISSNGGSIAGNLVYRTKQPIDDFSPLVIKGVVNHQELEIRPLEYRLRTAFMGLASMLVVGAVGLFFFGRKTKEVVDSVTTNWRGSFLFGLGALILVPIVSLFLLLTQVGAPLAFMLIALYGILIYVSGVFAHMVLGVCLLKITKVKYGSLWLPFCVGLLVMTTLQIASPITEVFAGIIALAIILPTFGTLIRWYQKTLK